MAEQNLPFPAHIPFVESLGLELHSAANGQAVLGLALTPSQHNSWAVAHGGVLMTLLDVAMAQAARSAVQPAPHGGGVATIEMKTSFVRPAQGRLKATGRVLHRASTMTFCEASVHDDEGKLCAHATGTFKLLRGLPARDGIKHTQDAIE